MTKLKPTVAKMIAFCDESPFELESKQYIVMQPRPRGRKGLWTIDVTYDMPVSDVVDMFIKEHLYLTHKPKLKMSIMPYVRLETETQHIRVFGYTRIFKWWEFKDLSKNDLIEISDVINGHVPWESECKAAFEAAMNSQVMEMILDNALMVRQSQAESRHYNDTGASAPHS